VKIPKMMDTPSDHNAADFSVTEVKVTPVDVIQPAAATVVTSNSYYTFQIDSGHLSSHRLALPYFPLRE